MITFVIVAALIAIGLAALLVIPLLRQAPAQPAPAPWAALVSAAVLVIGSTVMYVTRTNWSWRAEPAADSPATMVARLARKLERDPQDLNGWLMLGRSYVVLEQYPLALRAYERADRLAGGKNVDALVGEAESLALTDEAELDGRAGRIVEQALALDPKSGKALFFGAAAALRRGQLPIARDRFARLLALDPPANIKPMLEQQIAAIDQRLSGAAAGGGADAGGPAAPAGGTQVAGVPSGARGAAAGPAGAAAAPFAGSGSTATAGANANSPAVRVKVELAPALSAAGSAAAPLFVFVRDPAQPGPPLAVKRLESHFPQTVELTPSDSMVPGRAFAAGQKVQVVARIARSGNPIAGSGDPFGEVGYLVGRDGLVNIVIDHVTP